MEDKDEIIKQLKAEIYDANAAANNYMGLLNSLAEIFEVTQAEELVAKAKEAKEVLDRESKEVPQAESDSQT